MSKGQNIRRKDQGYVSMYGRELRLNGGQNNVRRNNYGQGEYWDINNDKSITSHRRDISYTFSKIGTNKFKEAVSNYYNESSYSERPSCI